MAIIRPMAKRKRSEHYVNNKEFLAALIKYQEDIEIARLQDKTKPVIPRYIGECFLKIANHLSFKPNFVNYMFKEDMISDGIENCVQYIHNFDPEKSKNPFAYFTQIIYYAFVGRIQKEKKQLYIKYKTMDSQASLGDNVEVSADDTQNYVYETMTNDQKANMYDFISNFEEAKKKKKVATTKKSTSLELFMGV